jgi:two-component system, OmpR family, response regulator
MSDKSLNPRETKSTIVLGVDDVPENLSLLKASVETAGYTFVGAKSGEECLRLMARIKPKLIVLDVQLPHMDGFETCRQIRRLSGTSGIPVAFLTVRKSAADVKTGIAAGGNDFIAKPYHISKLVERIKHWANRTVAPNQAGPAE